MQTCVHLLELEKFSKRNLPAAADDGVLDEPEEGVKGRAEARETLAIAVPLGRPGRYRRMKKSKYQHIRQYEIKIY